MEGPDNEQLSAARSSTRPSHQPPGAKSPWAARGDCRGPGITIHDDEHIKQQLRFMAVTLLKHERYAAPYEHRVREEDMSSLMYFLCAAHGCRPPEIHDVSAAAAVGTEIRLSLCHWESIYYALIAEIQYLYQKIYDLYTADERNGALILHNYGETGDEQHDPFTLGSFANKLVEFWNVLMNSGFLGPLDNSVRIENYANSFRADFYDRESREGFLEYWGGLRPEEKEEITNSCDGMMDAPAMMPGDIAEVLWHKYAMILNRACSEELEVEGTLVPRPVPASEAPATVEQPPPDDDDRNFDYNPPPCYCEYFCQCKAVCEFGTSTCSCNCEPGNNAGTPSNFRDVRMADRDQQMLVYSDRRTTPGHSAQQQVPPLRSPEPARLEALHALGLRANARNATGPPQARRERANTGLGQLVYVPEAHPRMPSRRAKDPYSLAFYDGSRSPQRYPPFPLPGSSQDISHDHGSNVPARRPVTPQVSTSSTADVDNVGRNADQAHVEFNDLHGPSPPPIQQPLRPRDPPATLSNPTTRSFPTKEVDPSRAQIVNEFEGWQYTKQSANLIGRSPVSRHSSPALESSSSANLLLPPSSTTQIDHINPRPALRQRYVAAGGDTPLHERPEIEAPVAPRIRGFTMTAAEYQHFLDRRNDAAGRNDSVTNNRASDDDFAVSSGPTTGTRNSAVDAQGANRTRGSSGASAGGVRNKLRRLLSGSQGSSQ